MVAPLQQMPPWLMQNQTAPSWANWAQPQQGQPSPPPPVQAPNLWQQATGQMSQTPVWAAPANAAPQPTTSWGQVGQRTEAPWMNYSRQDPTKDAIPASQATPQTAMGMGQSGQSQVQGTPLGTGQTGINAPIVGEFNTANATAGGTGAAWQGQDYRLPSGEVLPGAASFTLDIGGQQVRLPGYYDPNSATGGQPRPIFMNGTYPETAVQRLQRRLLDARGRGENINDPNVIYREMARVRDDAAAAIGSSDPNALRGATGFVHLDRFVRGANGETGYTPGPGATAPGAPPATGSGPTVPPGTDTVAPAVGGTGATATRNFGQFQTDDLAAALQAAANDPDRAAQILRMARGQDGGRPKGRMGEFRDSLYGRAFQAALSLAGTDGFQGMEGEAGSFLNNAVLGNNLMGHGADIGRRAAGQSFEGVDSRTMEQILRAGMAMQGIGMGSLGGAVQSGRLEDIIYQDWARNLGDSSNDTRNFADLLQGSAFQRAMQNFR